MRRCLRPVAAHRHAAPAPRVRFADVQEPQGAGWAFAFAHHGEILFANEIAHRFGNRQQQRLGAVPMALRLPAQHAAPLLLAIRNRDLTKTLVAREQRIQRRQLAQITLAKQLSRMIADKFAEPFAQLARLSGDTVERA